MSAAAVSKLIREKTTLSNLDLEVICKRLCRPVFVCMRNELTLDILRNNACFIINLEADNNGGGTHWIGIYRNRKTIYYCDSFGTPVPQNQFELFHNNGYNIYQSTKMIQDVHSSCCGWFAALFVTLMGNLTDRPPMQRFEHYQQQFDGSNQNGNDRKVKQLVSILAQ
jgi:hypothetical protein